MKHFLREYFTLSYSERNGLMLLLLLLTLLMLAPAVYRHFFPVQPAELKIVPLTGDGTDTLLTEESEADMLFPFDPNTIGPEELKKLGMDTLLMDQWLKYREAGGRFYEKDDLLKLYRMSKERYLRLEPYIRIGESRKKERRYSRQPLMTRTIDINDADSIDWLALPGIGPVYTHRILAYRRQVGVFYSIDELQEVYGMDSQRMERLRPYLTLHDSLKKKAVKIQARVKTENSEPEFIELNTVDSATLTRFKGIGPYYAQRIVRYRQALGGFYKKEQLYEIYRLDTAVADHILARASLDTTWIRKLNINRASAKELAAHPYISRAVADAIIRLRLDYVKIKDKKILLRSYLVDEELLRKIAPYIEL